MEINYILTPIAGAPANQKPERAETATTMGMDVYGKNPTSEAGKYFHNNVWWWRPLAIYCCETAPNITAQCQHWQSNDGDGLDAENALKLAAILREHITSGKTKPMPTFMRRSKRQSQIKNVGYAKEPESEPMKWALPTGKQRRSSTKKAILEKVKKDGAMVAMVSVMCAQTATRIHSQSITLPSSATF